MNDMTSNMISYLIITVFMVIFSSIGLSDFEWNKKPDSLDTITFDYDKNFKLSEDGRVALHELINTKSFTSDRIGMAGRFSQSFDNFTTVLYEGNAISAFKKIIEQGSTEGKAYAILGIKILDSELYKEIEPAIEQSKLKFSVQGGCSISDKMTFSEHDIPRIAPWFGISAERRFYQLQKAATVP